MGRSRTIIYDHNKEIQENCYYGLPLLRSKKIRGFSESILNNILKIFEYTDSLKSFTPRFVRFNFWKGCAKSDVQQFFKNVVENHRKKGRCFFYLCTMEEVDGNIHYHAFCVISRHDYKHRTIVAKMLKKHANSIQRNNSEKFKLNIPRNPYRADQLSPNQYIDEENKPVYNFYSLSRYSKVNTDFVELREAFWAASYLAKMNQQPNVSKGTRTIFKSTLTKLTPDDIRPNFEQQFSPITDELFE